MMLSLCIQIDTFGTEDALCRARVASCVVARIALAERIVVDLDTRRVQVEGATCLLVEALLTQFLCWRVTIESVLIKL